VLLWKAIATGHNDILELISTILDELLELNGKFLLCCDETNANLDEIINKLDVLIQNLIDCCEGICDRLDTIIEILEEKYPEGVEYGITYDDYICVEEWDCDVGGEYLECNFEDCLPEPPEIVYGVTWDGYICVEEAETTTTTTVTSTTTTTELPTTTTTTCIIGAGLIEVLCEDWTTTTTEELATTTTTTQVGTTTTTTTIGTTSTTTLVPTTTTTTELATTTTTTILPTTTTTEEPTTTTTTILEPETDYGYLYNWWAAIGDTNGDDVSEEDITTSDDWQLPTAAEYYVLLKYLDASGDEFDNIAGGKMKETGTIYWDSPNTGATNSSGFNSRGTGYRTDAGNFTKVKSRAHYWNKETIGSTYAKSSRLFYDDDYFYTSNPSGTSYGEKRVHGLAIRFIKSSTTLSHGETGTYTGNNGITYPTICIGTQEWLACNLEETKFRDGSDIPYIDNQYAEDNAEWAAATSAAYCIYPIT
jgi:uncharacterized protein (TIGR02145 family)